MARIIAVLIIFAWIGFITGDPIGKPCPNSTQVHTYLETLKRNCFAQIKTFDDAPGKIESKYSQFVIAWTNIASFTKKLLESSFPESCLKGKKKVHENVSGHLVRFLKIKSETSEKEYLTYTDPKIISKIEDKASEVDDCFENSRNLTGISPEDTDIHFCSYDMPEALKCAKKLFEDDELTGLIGFTDYFINEFDCNAYLRVGIKDTATLEFYYHIVDHWEKKERQSFFHGFQRAALDFTRYT